MVQLAVRQKYRINILAIKRSGTLEPLPGPNHTFQSDETLLILGGTAGNLMDLFHLPLAGAGTAFLALWGLALGVFVGCLVMSLAETLKRFQCWDGVWGLRWGSSI